MTYEEESFVLNTLKKLKEFIRSPTFVQLVKETHENNVMLKSIIKYLNRENLLANQENENDFIRNIMANLISNGIDIGFFNKR